MTGSPNYAPKLSESNGAGEGERQRVEGESESERREWEEIRGDREQVTQRLGKESVQGKRRERRRRREKKQNHGKRNCEAVLHKGPASSDAWDCAPWNPNVLVTGLDGIDDGLGTVHVPPYRKSRLVRGGASFVGP